MTSRTTNVSEVVRRSTINGSVRYEVIRKYDYFDMAKKAGVYDVLITRDDASDEEVKQAHETLIRFLHTAELIRPITIQE